MGTTVWVAEAGDDCRVFLAWDWALVPPGIVVAADPCAIASNVRLVAGGLNTVGHNALDQTANMLALASMVNRLPWQQAVALALDGYSRAQAPPNGAAAGMPVAPARAAPPAS